MAYAAAIRNFLIGIRRILADKEIFDWQARPGVRGCCSAPRPFYITISGGYAMRVLIVDDSAGFTRALHGFLQTLPGVEVVGQALTGGHGLRLAEHLRPDLVLLDWMMPGMNGPQTARALKGLPGPPKIVLLSLLNGPECIADAEAAGADGFIFKGEVTERLPGLIANLFGSH
jgi:CheY-like chemotaxis protein